MAFGTVPEIACGLIARRFARASIGWTVGSFLLGLGMVVIALRSQTIGRCRRLLLLTVASTSRSPPPMPWSWLL